jgi:hypothetical protein
MFADPFLTFFGKFESTVTVLDVGKPFVGDFVGAGVSRLSNFRPTGRPADLSKYQIGQL